MTLSFLFSSSSPHKYGYFINSHRGVTATTDMAVLLSELIKFFTGCFKIKPKEEVSILITKITVTAGDW